MNNPTNPTPSPELLPCRCGGECRVELMGGGIHVDPWESWVCSNNTLFGGTCTRPGRLSADDWNEANRTSPRPPSADVVERDIRIALWNAIKTELSIGDDACYRVINKAVPLLLAALPTHSNDAVEALNHALIVVGLPKGWEWDINDIVQMLDAMRALSTLSTAAPAPVGDAPNAGDAIDWACDHASEPVFFLEDWRKDGAAEWPEFHKWFSVQRNGARQAARHQPTGDDVVVCGANSSPIPADMVGCGGSIATAEEVYRCTHCDVPFHKACAEKHFRDDDVLTEEMIVEIERRAALSKPDAGSEG